jgi:poly(A) polymerase
VNATRSLLEDNGESKKYWCFVISLIGRYYTSFENKQEFVSGKDVIQIRGTNGANVGRILNLLDEQYFCGLIKSRQDAVDFIMNVEIDNKM